MKNRNFMITTLSLLLSVAFLFGCKEDTTIANVTKPEPAAPPAAASSAANKPADKATGDAKKYGSVADVPRISLEDAKKAFDAGTAVFVDSRPEPAYKDEHIAGAINIPNGANAHEKFSSLPKGKKIIVYCS